jgi:hypothetical protein
MREPAGQQFRDASGVVVGVASKAANGDGSVHFDASKGRYRATFIDLEGRRRTVLGTTRAEALSRRDAKIDEMAAPPTSALGTSPTVVRLLSHRRQVRADRVVGSGSVEFVPQGVQPDDTGRHSGR